LKEVLKNFKEYFLKTTKKQWSKGVGVPSYNVVGPSYQNMLINLGFCFINYNFVLYVMYITPHLHVINDFQNFEVLKHTLNFHNF
jgi:hypothetical protein